nr:MAG TPA: hypothetical protein [Caudoviricetes sp.]
MRFSCFISFSSHYYTHLGRFFITFLFVTP